MAQPLYLLDRKKVFHRLLIMWVMALLIAIQQAYTSAGQYSLSMTLGYSYGISTSIWLLSDPARWWLQRWLSDSIPLQVIYQIWAILIGYFLGTYIGDSLAGVSTWGLLQNNPQKFKALLMTSVLISIGFCAFYYQQSRSQAFKRLQIETQMRLLQSQLEPHMLFNTLANLRGLISQDPAQAQHMLDQLVAFLRSSLNASRQPQHTLKQEFEALNNYFQLMHIRMGERLQVTFDLPNDLQDHLVPSLMLQPLAENSIRHGLEPQIEGGHIRVSAQRNGQQLTLCVQDSGVGFTEQSPSAQSYGLTHVRERLNAMYGSEAQLRIESSSDAPTRVCIDLPLTPTSTT